MKRPCRLASGRVAELVRADTERAELDSAEAFPPGSTLAFTLLPLAGESESGRGELSLRLKVKGCRALAGAGELAFRIEGRFIGLTRADRERLLGAGAAS